MSYGKLKVHCTGSNIIGGEFLDANFGIQSRQRPTKRRRSSVERSKFVSRNSPWNLISRPTSWTTRGLKWKFIGAWSYGPNARQTAWTHACSGAQWITNIVSRMRILFHFHAGFTGRRDYQSRGLVFISFLIFVSRPSFPFPSLVAVPMSHRGFGHSEIAIRQFEANNKW